MKLYIFDLDGTLLNTLGDLAASVNYALKQMHLPERSLEEVRFMVGNGVEMLIRRAVNREWPNDADTTTDEQLVHATLAHFRSYYLNHSKDTTLPYPGIMELLQQLKREGKTIAVVSNKFDAATKALCNEYFNGLVDIAIGEDEANGIKRKPAPDTVEAVIRQSGIDKCESVYIGDSDVDIQTARNASIPCISVLWGFRDKDFLLQHGGNIFASSPADILNYRQQ